MNLNKLRLTLLCGIVSFSLQAQSLMDGIYMPKQSFCTGIMLTQDQFDNYWEGTTKRYNLNMGTMTMQGAGVMATYGLSDKLNIVASAPYLQTKTSAGVMMGQSGVQDLTVGLKYKMLNLGDLSVNVILGGSIPTTNYVAAYPLAIGSQSKTAFGRIMLHYLTENGWTATMQTTSTYRSNIKIDATNYYTDRNIFSNEVSMPNTASVTFRGGYYSYRVAAEAFIERYNTLGGFDIRRNDMMFPSNKRISTVLGFTGFYRVKPLNNLQIMVNIARTLSGRNVGETMSMGLGLMMAFDFKKKEAETKPVNNRT
jgi:hypothetical protein